MVSDATREFLQNGQIEKKEIQTAPQVEQQAKDFSEVIRAKREELELKKIEIEIAKLNQGATDNTNPFNQVLEILKESHAKDLDFLGQINDLKVQVAQLETGGEDGQDDGILSFVERIAPYLPQILNRNNTQSVPIGTGLIEESKGATAPAPLIMENKTLENYKQQIKEGKIKEPQAWKDLNRFSPDEAKKFTREQFKAEFDKIKNG